MISSRFFCFFIVLLLGELQAYAQPRTGPSTESRTASAQPFRFFIGAGIEHKDVSDYRGYEDCEAGLSLTMHDSSYRTNITLAAATDVYNVPHASDITEFDDYIFSLEVAPELHVTDWFWIEPTLIGRLDYYNMTSCFCELTELSGTYLQYGVRFSAVVEPQHHFRMQVGMGYLNINPKSDYGNPTVPTLSIRMMVGL